MKIVVAQINPKIGDLDGNTRMITDTIQEARDDGYDLVLFPELTICGYAPEDLLLHNSFIDGMQQHLEQIIKASHGIAVIVGLARRNLFYGEKGLFNSVAIIQDGHLLGFQDKWLLPTYDVFNERRYFEPGQETRIWDIKGKRVGIVICEDIWQHAGYVDLTSYERDPIQELVKYKPDLLLNSSASPYQFQRPDVRIKVCEKASRSLNCPVILCCQVGSNDQIIFDGYSVYISKEGTLCRLGKGFQEEKMCIDLDHPSCEASFEYNPMNDLFEALVLGVKDYFKKSNFEKACLGLSGGIDSALVACIAKEALGEENVIGVCMPSKYTSDESIEDAHALAKNLGIKCIDIPIKPGVETLLTTLHPFFEGKEEDVTEENLQSRIRGIILMSLSNKHNYIVLSTGNKSETAMGYCTLYGDMCGGLGVIGDVVKTKVYELCRFLNSKKPGTIPQRIIDKPPSAELKPNQIDLDALPDYQIVDHVLEGYVEDYLRVDNIAEKYKIPVETVMNLVRKIHRAEYKRRQGPPILRVSKKSFGVGRHYPIVQGWM
ncbi:NAD+ synthase [Candidatus Aerophobetes bacterium]|uniref:Glutamine-dependent NAD(+) synthetase n=1 Tax=Aerophobetes bacterium TaxID=2030807 RepID=A0A2A4YNZ6_UNCAE|nr:MAG: NAD+ synthase [Candidatus Aerophobetes bacterium]